MQTKQTQFAVCVPSRKEAARREQVKRNMESWMACFAASAASNFAHGGKVTKAPSGFE